MCAHPIILPLPEEVLAEPTEGEAALPSQVCRTSPPPSPSAPPPPGGGGFALSLILLARLWQLGPSRVLPPSCRYAPSCSAYAIEAWTRYGAWRGSWLASKRLLRCHPWGGCGVDPVP